MSEQTWIQEAECDRCDATGLYVGMAERDGAAVVCYHCKGTGKREIRIKWRPFVERKVRDGVLRVFEANPGVIVAGHRYFGGVAYEDWLNGEPFSRGSEMREHTCPAWWYQSTDYARKPDWRECSKNLGRTFSSCSEFSRKDQCWRRFDAEERQP